MSHTKVKVCAMESVVISGKSPPFNDSLFPQKLGILSLSPSFQSTKRPRITAGALFRSHIGRWDGVCENTGRQTANVSRRDAIVLLFIIRFEMIATKLWHSYQNSKIFGLQIVYICIRTKKRVCIKFANSYYYVDFSRWIREKLFSKCL